jgi:hypothetical protein
LVFSHWDNQALTATVTDNLGNTYVPITGPVNVAPTARFQAWYAKNIRGGSQLGVTITYSGKTSSISLLDVAEYSGLDTSSPLDVVASATGTGTTQDSGPSPMTSSTSETIVGLLGYSAYASPFTAGTDFTLRGYDASSMLEDESVFTQAQYDATAISSGSTNWVSFVVGFKNAH